MAANKPCPLLQPSLLLSALLNWLKLVYGPFEQTNLHVHSIFARPVMKESNVPEQNSKRVSEILLS